MVQNRDMQDSELKLLVTAASHDMERFISDQKYSKQYYCEIFLAPITLVLCLT